MATPNPQDRDHPIPPVLDYGRPAPKPGLVQSLRGSQVGFAVGLAILMFGVGMGIDRSGEAAIAMGIGGLIVGLCWPVPRRQDPD